MADVFIESSSLSLHLFKLDSHCDSHLENNCLETNENKLEYFHSFQVYLQHASDWCIRFCFN